MRTSAHRSVGSRFSAACEPDRRSPSNRSLIRSRICARSRSKALRGVRVVSVSGSNSVLSRARVNGETHALDDPPTLDKQKKHTIEVVVDRLAVKSSAKRRLTDSVETALGLAGGLVVFDFVDAPARDPHRELRFSERMACPNEHAIETDELEPRSFSFNSPFGACAVCHGLGTRMEVDPELVVSDPGPTLGEGAIQPWTGAHVADYFLRLMNALGEELGFDLNTPWEKLPAKAKKSLIEGHPTKVHVVTTNRYGRQRAYYAQFDGVFKGGHGVAWSQLFATLMGDDHERFLLKKWVIIGLLRVQRKQGENEEQYGCPPQEY